MAAAPPQRSGMASGAVNAARQLGFAVGIALLGTVFSTRLQDAVTATAGPGGQDLAHALTSGQAHHVLATAPTAARPALDTLIHQGFASGLDATFVVAAVAAVLAGLIAITLIRPASVAASADLATPGTSSPEGAMR